MGLCSNCRNIDSCKSKKDGLRECASYQPVRIPTKHDGPEIKEMVNHPEHYSGKYECIDEMVALFGVEAVKHFCMCNVYKYRFRADRKDGERDVKKAEWYMEKLMELGKLEDSENNINSMTTTYFK